MPKTADDILNSTSRKDPMCLTPCKMILVLGLVHLLSGCASGGIANDGEAPEPNPLPGDPVNNTNNNTEEGKCNEEPCAVGRFVCIGENEIHVCRQTPDNCALFVLNEVCQGSRVCVDALCVEPGACIDQDSDLHGLNCDAGPDCNDMDPTRHNGADELCDNKDNDCDGIEDEGDVCRSDCAQQECAPGDRECLDAITARECQTDLDGCGAWSLPVECNDQCEDGLCQDVNCVDRDGDLRGLGCAFGTDCDDNDPARFEGNTELCDAVDNDCDMDVDENFGDLGQLCQRGQGLCESDGVFQCTSSGTDVVCDATPGQPSNEVCGNNQDDDCDGATDEGFEVVGQSCEVGQGACLRTGVIECDAQSTRCDASPGQPTNEVCDGVDNNCNGIADDGGVCGCLNDSHEPDQRSSDGFSLPTGQSTQATLCGEGRDGADWIRLGTYNAGQTIDLQIDFNAPDSLIHMELYAPDFTFLIASPLSNSGHSLTQMANQTGEYFLWLFPNSNPEPGLIYNLHHQ